MVTKTRANTVLKYRHWEGQGSPLLYPQQAKRRGLKFKVIQNTNPPPPPPHTYPLHWRPSFPIGNKLIRLNITRRPSLRHPLKEKRKISVSVAWTTENRELKQRRFWATDVNRKWGLFPLNPLSPNSDQDQISPNNIHTLSRDKLWELIIWSPQGKCFDLLSNSLNSFFKEMLEISLENLYVDTGAWRVNESWRYKICIACFFALIETIWLKIWAKPPLKNVKNPVPVNVRRSKTPLLKLP